MTFSNFALWWHKNIDHLVIYHLKDVCELCRRSLDHFSWVNVIPRGVVVEVNVNFDTWISWQRQKCGWPLLRQNVRVVNLSITHDCRVPSLSFNVSRSSGNSNSNLHVASVTLNFGLVFTPVWWYRCPKFEIPSKHDTVSNFCWLSST